VIVGVVLAWIPVPLIAMVCEAPVTFRLLSAIPNVPEFVPLTVGIKSTA